MNKRNWVQVSSLGKPYEKEMLPFE